MTASPIFACIDKRGGTAGTGTHGHRANSKPVYTAAVLRPALDLFLFFFIPSIFVSFLFYTSLAPTPRAAAGGGWRRSGEGTGGVAATHCHSGPLPPLLTPRTRTSVFQLGTRQQRERERKKKKKNTKNWKLREAPLFMVQILSLCNTACAHRTRTLRRQRGGYRVP